MFESPLKIILGSILFLASSTGLLLNLTVVSPVFQLAFARDKSSIYVISSVNIVNDIAHLMITTFYLAPTIILNSFIVSEERNNNVTVFISFIFMVLWYIGNITQIVMAVNRFLVDQSVLSYSYFQIENITNYTDQSDIPLNALSSIIPVICYTWIFYTIRSASKSITPDMRTGNQKRRGLQELSYAMQFCLISLFYTFSWIMFRIFPIIFNGRQIEWFILTSLCHVLNCSANAFVYIVFNQESFLVSNRKKSPWTLAFGSAFMFLWYFETITQMIMAFDRYVIICLRKHNLFTFTSTLVMFSLLIPISFVIMYHSQYMNPCCAFLFDQEYLSYSYYPIEGVPNYSDRFDLPLNASSSIISAICYILIFWTVHNSSATFSTVAGDQQKVRRRRDIRFAIQFSLLLVFYIFVWVLFRILPILLADRHVEWFILVPIFYTINCTSNAIIYIFFNSEVQSHLIPSQLISVLRYLGITQTSTPVQNRTIASVTAYSSVAPITHVAIRFIPVRKHQPFRSIGLLQNMNQSVV
ncbi:hypothetical protein B9Z55_020057 [Caenorhabditis nigoni]|uniref:7TM GPCR serpentine receptor class x (Srx) domain-containing protein n=1 Tax=Caenorhabditis nigoni TaxID=1611254 RepID=A0A2G5TL43_9PELO|nr:hypothetical protein B9Z55_020057 [Caenorhabditis nigoni]